MAHDKENSVNFKDTLNLPQTDFPIRSNPQVDDPAMIARWQEENLFYTSFEHNKGAKKFILHDGPPYANGHLHLGHAYNNILKDIVTKSQRMQGKHVPVTPGWDCHGLPIEHKVTQENPGLSPTELKKACRAYATHWINVQRQERKDLGVLMNWDHPYITMDPHYEAWIMRAFGEFVAGGYIERKNKTVPWCFSCQTVLATAEIEYEDRKDPSIYVQFPLPSSYVERLLPQLKGKEVSLLVWTTTPWTLPLNRAVLIKPDAQYVVLQLKDQYVMMAKERAAAIAALVKEPVVIVAEIDAQELIGAGTQVRHPFLEITVPLIADASVSLTDGTAFVHCAPGCGPEDYEVGVRNNLEIYSPVGPDGKYTNGVVPQELAGMSVTDGQIWVIKKLAHEGRLLHKETIRHSYPHCWRCHNGLIFRATKQWFCDMARGDLKQRALQAADGIATVPDKSINRLKATIDGRLEWCLSRQRVWGVPIPAVLCTTCDYTYVTPELIEQVAAGVHKEGIEYWDSVSVEQLLPVGYTCKGCKGTQFIKETDILDVWFDSGISHYAVLLRNPALAFPADMYLEGKDQHRGWFQSSLLTAMVLEKEAPMRTLVTHGFTVDAQGRKMSKSLGNTVVPADIVKQIGTDGLRLWVSSIDVSGEAVVSELLLRNVAEVYRKIRNTCRFLLSNLYDYNHDTDAVPYDELLAIDKYALHELQQMHADVRSRYNDFDFTAIFHALAQYCAVDLSAFYLDIIKDRLYVEKANGRERRSAQTACWYILDTLTRAMAPILSFTAEQISDYYQKNKTTSIHLQNFAPLDAQYTLEDAVYTQWQQLRAIRGAVLKAVEPLREQGVIKHPLEVRLTLYIDEPLRANLASLLKGLPTRTQTIAEFFKEFFIASQVILADSKEGLQATEVPHVYCLVEHARGTKCPRCWQWEETTDERGLCSRCQSILK